VINGFLKPSLLKKAVFRILLFLFPTQLAYHFWPSWAYVFGIRVDYLAPTIYLTDVLIFLFIVLSFASLKIKNLKFKIYKQRKTLQLLILFGGIIFVILNISVAKLPFAAFFKCLKLVELAVFGYLVAKDRDIKVSSWIIKPLSWGIILTSILGLAEFFLGHSVNGIFYWLGERYFTLATPGISSTTLFNREVVRVYSTFSHPNSLAGFYGVSLLLTYIFRRKRNAAVCNLLFSLILLLMFLSFSQSAIIALIITAVFYFLYAKTKDLSFIYFKNFWIALFILSLLLPVFAKEILAAGRFIPENIYNRLVLADVAGALVAKSPFVGIGLNNFVVSITANNFYLKTNWFLQPVHNIFLLVFAETGFCGLLASLFLILRVFNKLSQARNWQLATVLIFIFVTGFTDHYWFTLQQNQLLLSLVLGLSFRKNGHSW
jgi:hypothetical protein